MHKKPTQRERVLAALDEAGTRGICATDFLLPSVVDDGQPILRLPAPSTVAATKR